MLSDKGSAVIRRYGILNTNIPPTHTFYGIPFPGEFLVAPDGRVADKVFLPDFQDRATASEVLLKDFGIGAGNDVVEIKSDETSARIQLSDSSAFSGQDSRSRLILRSSPDGIFMVSRCPRVTYQLR